MVDGLDVLEQVKSDPSLRGIPVVMLTSSREEKDLLQGYHAGVNAYVVKPAGFRDCIAAIQDLGVLGPLLTAAPPGGSKSRR